MAIASVLLYLVVVYIRPAELVDGWQDFPFAAITEVIALLVVGLSWVVRPRNFVDEPEDLFVVGFVVTAIISNPAWGWLGGGILAADLLLPVLGCYLLIRAAVRSAKHLRWLANTLVVLTLFLAVNGINQYRTGTGFGNVSAFTQRVQQQEVTDGTEQPTTVARIRGSGIFNDPNDLAMAFVGVVPFLIGPVLVRRTPFFRRTILLLIAVPVLAALFLTNSRGGMVGVLAAMTPYLWRSKSMLPRVMVVLGVVALLALGPSRMSEVDSDDDSSQGRLQAWSAGLGMLKDNPVLGVGFNRFTEFHELAAHNSFVHTFGELGFVGCVFFTGMFYWLFRGLLAAPPGTDKGDPELAKLQNWGEDLLGGSVGLATCMIFLSRQYAVVVFIWLAMGASYRSLLQTSGVSLPTSLNVKDNAAILATAAGGIVAIYIAVRVLAVWSFMR